MDCWDLNRCSNSASTHMNQSSLSFTETAAVETGEHVFEKKFFTEADGSGMIDFVDEHVKKLHVGDEKVVAIFDGVGVTCRPGKL